MAFDFPATPSSGAIFSPAGAGGPSYKWDGEKWQFYSAVAYAAKTASQQNLLVNPCGHVSQENGATAGTVSGYYAADQWLSTLNLATGAHSFQNYATLNRSGSIARLQFKVTTAKASLAAGEWAGILTKVEGTRARALNYQEGGSAPLASVLCFALNAPAGTYTVALRNAGYLNLCYIGAITVTAGEANADIIRTLPIPAPPIGAYSWAYNTSPAIELWITLACGSSLIAPATGWQTGGYVAAPGQTNLFATVNNTVQVWDAALYPDPDNTGIAPAFIVPDYDDDLLDSKRYYQRGLFPLRGGANVGTISRAAAALEVEMRVAPTCSIYGSFNAYNAYSGTAPVTGLGTSYATTKVIEFDATVGTWTSNAPNGNGPAMVYQGQAGGIACNARM